jgi:predicted nucleotidyltransferase
VRTLADQLRGAHPQIRQIRWFGSWTSGRATASSDVDLCIIVDHADGPIRARASDYMPSNFPQPLDFIILTTEEWAQLPNRSPDLHRAIQAGSIV